MRKGRHILWSDRKGLLVFYQVVSFTCWSLPAPWDTPQALKFKSTLTLRLEYTEGGGGYLRAICIQQISQLDIDGLSLLPNIPLQSCMIPPSKTSHLFQQKDLHILWVVVPYFICYLVFRDSSTFWGPFNISCFGELL